jgi:trk system potassium uptake protein TrkH
MAGGMSLLRCPQPCLHHHAHRWFFNQNASVAHFDSAYIDVVITVFMLLAGINFSLHYQLLKGRPLAFWKDSECRFYLVMCLVLTIVVGIQRV